MIVRKPETCKHFVDLGIDGVRWVLNFYDLGDGIILVRDCYFSGVLL
jgi:hypothetical protein